MMYIKQSLLCLIDAIYIYIHQKLDGTFPMDPSASY